jgi:hypothetical protein
MKAAHEGVSVAGLPLGTWRNADTPNPDAPPLPPLDLTGAQAPMLPPGGRGGGSAHPSSAPAGAPPPAPNPGPRGALGSAAVSAPIPPAAIPNTGAGPAARGKGLLNRLFGTL